MLYIVLITHYYTEEHSTTTTKKEESAQLKMISMLFALEFQNSRLICVVGMTVEMQSNCRVENHCRHRKVSESKAWYRLPILKNPQLYISDKKTFFHTLFIWVYFCLFFCYTYQVKKKSPVTEDMIKLYIQCLLLPRTTTQF